MTRFYYRFQWVALILAPFVLLFGPSLLNIKTAPEDTSWLPAAAVFLFLLLLIIAVITTRRAQLTGHKYLPRRVFVFLESSYVSVVAILLTSGSSADEHSNSAVVSVLNDRGLALQDAWFINDIARFTLFAVLFIFLATALVSALRDLAGLTHRTISRYGIIRPDDEDAPKEL